MTIVDYINAINITVQFKSGNCVKTQYGNFKRGSVKDANDKITRINECNVNNCGSKMKIIMYINYKNVIVKFDNNYITKCTYQSFRCGNVANPYDKTLCGIGYIGEGQYKTKINDKFSKQYITWDSMILRCYYNKYLDRRENYIDSIVIEKWHNFQNFAKWYDENFYKINNETMCLDKDILIKGNNIYSPETCIFVPQNINLLFLKSDKSRGDYPIGVTYLDGDYMARCQNNDGTREYLGRYSTPEKAFEVYKKYKEKIIKDIADKYKKYIPQKLYDAMYVYKVEITD